MGKPDLKTIFQVLLTVDADDFVSHKLFAISASATATQFNSTPIAIRLCISLKQSIGCPLVE